MVGGQNCELCVWDPTPHARFACPRVRTRARLDRACARLRLPSDRVLARAYAPGAYVRAVNYFARDYLLAREGYPLGGRREKRLDTDSRMVQSVTVE